MADDNLRLTSEIFIKHGYLTFTREDEQYERYEHWHDSSCDMITWPPCKECKHRPLCNKSINSHGLALPLE